MSFGLSGRLMRSGLNENGGGDCRELLGSVAPVGATNNFESFLWGPNVLLGLQGNFTRFCGD